MPLNPIPMLSPAERRRERLRKRLFEVARALYVENGRGDGGFENTTIEAIAERADISVRSFFRYFSSKADVIFLDIERANTDLVAFVEARLNNEPPVAALVNGMLDQLYFFFVDPLNRERLCDALSAPQFRERLSLMRDQQRALLVDLLTKRTAMPQQEIRVLVTMMRSAMTEVIEGWHRDTTQDPAQSMLALFVSVSPIVEQVTQAARARVRAEGKGSANRTPVASGAGVPPSTRKTKAASSS